MQASRKPALTDTREKKKPNRYGKRLFDQTAYDPNHLMDALIVKLKLKNDAALACMLGVLPPFISKIRHRRLPVGPSMLIRMHEISDWSIRELRGLMLSETELPAKDCASQCTQQSCR